MAALSLPISAAGERRSWVYLGDAAASRTRPSTFQCRLQRRRGTLQCTSTTAARSSTDGSDPTASTRGAVLVLPGFLSSSWQYAGLVADLQGKGFAAEVVPMTFPDWLPVLGGSSFEWYLGRLDAALQALHARHGRVALIGHSAGGWIARILLGSEAYQGVQYRRSDQVHTLLTLGTPHHSIEAYPFGRAEEALAGTNLDQAPAAVRGSSLQFANHFYPTADSLGGGVRVVCACGNAIRGRQLWGSGRDGSSAEDGSSSSCYDSDDGGSGISRVDQYFAFESYKCNCGQGEVDGDGVTPLCIAYLPGAEELVLPGVWHSPRRQAGQLWYGDAAVQEQWQQYLLEPQGRALSSK